ncbi:PKD domain-containing protein [Thermoflexus hugenholtzii]
MGAQTVRLVMFRVVVPALAGVLIALGLEQAFAAIWTDKLDYSPGEVVTISGDNSNGAGYLPGETVRVEVWGPNGYYATCEAPVDGNGAWSCQVTLWPDERAIGEYTYTARGLTSGVQESGTFWDGGNLDYAPQNITFNNVSPSTTLTFTQIVTAPDGNDAFTATLKVTGLPSGWNVSASPSVLNFSGGPNTQSWTIIIQVPAGTGSGSYSFNVKANPQKTGGQQTPGEGNGTQVTVNVSAPTPTPTPTPTPVPNQAPVVTAPADQTANEGEAKTFNLGSFTDDSTGPWQITVNWGDGNTESFSVSATGTIPSRTHTYADNGNYAVTVTVTDNNEVSGSASFRITVNNVSPVATFTATSPIDEGSSSTLAFTNAFDPSAADTNAGFRYAFACDGNLGSLPTSYAAAGVLDSASCLFQDNGSFIVAGRIFDKDDGYSTYTQTVQVNNVPPTVSIVSLDQTIDCRKDATLTFSFSDPGVNDHPWNVTIDWGDRNTNSFDASNQDEQYSVSHAYALPGTYMVTVRVTDKDGGEGSATRSITVEQVYAVDFLPPFDDSSPSGLIVNTMKNGRVVPVKATIYDVCRESYVNDPTTEVTIKVSKTSGNGNSDAVEEYADAGQSSAGTNHFRWTADSSVPGGGFWIYNLDSKALGLVVNNLYRIDIHVGSNLATRDTWAVLKPVK